jgi:hypothetical protein
VSDSDRVGRGAAAGSLLPAARAAGLEARAAVAALCLTRGVTVDVVVENDRGLVPVRSFAGRSIGRDSLSFMITRLFKMTKLGAGLY